jgi:dihydroorotate dehydrogenase (NAD+) catalytic subunit
MLSGASAVEIASPVMIYGNKLLTNAIVEFTQYLQNMGLNARDLIGVAADQRRSFMEMSRMLGNWRNYVPADCLGPDGAY